MDNILTKAYNNVKRTITFEFFKRKFNSWYEQKEISYLEQIDSYKQKLMDCLAEHSFESAYYNYGMILHVYEELENLPKYKNFVLK